MLKPAPTVADKERSEKREAEERKRRQKSKKRAAETGARDP